MKLRFHRLPTASLFALLFFAPLHAAVMMDMTLPGSQDTTVWSSLGRTNVGMVAAAGTGAVAVQAPGYQAGVGLYSFSTDYSATVTQASIFDVQTVVFQADLAPNPDFPIPFSGGPLLSFNGGMQNLVASYFMIQGTETRNTTMGPQTYSGAAWQWNLSGLGETINSVSVLHPYSVHTTVAGLRIDSGSSFLQMIPEPSSGLLAGLAAGVMACRRQRRG